MAAAGPYLFADIGKTGADKQRATRTSATEPTAERHISKEVMIPVFA